jgi:hypothetical protein|tara:strand:+ start:1551 stop:1706 length:156 start_codon:yes stop_codon:yes gene_type:complete
MSNFSQLVIAGVVIHKIRMIVENNDDKSSKELKSEIKDIIYNDIIDRNSNE